MKFLAKYEKWIGSTPDSTYQKALKQYTDFNKARGK